MALATACGAGYTPRAPGTAGAAVAIPIFVLLSFFGIAVYLWVVMFLFGIGVWASGHAESHFARKDDSRIVIDEVVGQLIALGPLIGWLPPFGLSGFAAIVTAFVSFRLFDIWKPRPIAWAERTFSGGWGVMMDDVFAGTLAVIPVVAARIFLGAAG